MGGIRWLDRIDPVKWSAAIRWIEAERPVTEAAVGRFLETFGREVDDGVRMRLADLGEEPAGVPDFLGAVLEVAVTEESWDLGKSLRAFECLPDLVPSLSPLRKIIDFEGIDVPIPRWGVPVDPHFYGCLSPGAYRSCLDAVERLGTLTDIVAALREVTPRVRRSLGRTCDPARVARELQRHGDCWRDLKEALSATAERNHYLGLGQST